MPATAKTRGVKTLQTKLYRAVLFQFFVSIFLSVSAPATADTVDEGAWVCQEAQGELEEKKINKILAELQAGKDPLDTHLKGCTELSLFTEEQILRLLPMDLVTRFEITEQPGVYYLYYRNTVGGEVTVKRPAIFWRFRVKEDPVPSEDPVWEEET